MHAVDGDGDYFHSTWTCDACGHEELTTHPKAPKSLRGNRVVVPHDSCSGSGHR